MSNEENMPMPVTLSPPSSPPTLAGPPGATAAADSSGDSAPALPLDPALVAAVPRQKGPRFDQLGLGPDVLRALEAMGFQESMEVQAATIPAARTGRDLMVQSRTGSGKTAAFGIPFVNDVVDPAVKAVQAIVLLPTRELALQVAAELARIAQFRPITVAPIYGGAPMGRQVEMLRAGAQIVCGTPGRILDHLRRGTLVLDRVRCAVLDECDEMLSMGFQEDIEHILEQTPATRQTLLFSATVPEGIQRLSRRFMKNPEFLKLSADFVGVNEIRHVYYSIPGINREQELLRILNFEDPKTAIVFCNTREETGRVAEFLRKQGFEAEAISSDLAQNDRERVMARMRAGGIRFLVATDVAARGIDIEALSHVFNYTFPEAPEIYIHRTGRTGRAGKHGTAISMIGPTEVGSFYYLKLLYKIRPEERALPSEAEIRSHREGERVLTLRQALQGEPGTQWRDLARRLTNAVDGERLVAALLAQSFSSLPAMPPPPVVKPVTPALSTAGSGRQVAARGADERPGATDGGAREGGARDRSDRNDRPGRERPRDRDRERPVRTDRAAGPGRARLPERGRDRPPERDRGAPRPGSVPPAGSTPQAEKEFWEVWSEEKAAQGAAPGGAGAGVVGSSASESDGAADTGGVPGAIPSTTVESGGVAQGGFTARPGRERAPRPAFQSAGPSVPEGAARLYLNLGRKDGASESEVRKLLQEHAGIADVLEIDVMNTHTYLNVTDADADRICASLTGKQVGERDLLCERARPRR
ncbi:MAG: DEAD/DEAH box helicase, partial [Polyangia bacterium]